MKNKWNVCIATALAAVTSLTVFASINVKAEGVDMIKFSNDIAAVTPHGGETVSVVHSGMESILKLPKLTVEEIGKYYCLTPEMQEFVATGVVPGREELLACYDSSDDFAPVGNVLEWKSEISADSYTVNVALDKRFTQVVFTDTVEETSVNLGNTLYSGTDYYWQVIANNGETKTHSQIFAFTTKAGTRTVDIDGVTNSRDVGGYATPNGTTAQGMIYRTARLDDVTDEGKAAVAKLGIKTDLDLRAVGEGMENPLDISYVRATPAPLYTNGIATPEGKAAIKMVFQTFANKDNYPIAMHCSVGRDRTGTAVALLNGLLGVDEQTIVNEYMLSVFGYLSTFQKGSDALINNINGYTAYVHTFAGETFAEKTENLLLDAGVTAEEIQSVKDIMLGATNNYDNTVACETSYEGMHFVTVKAYGHQTQTWAVKDGVVLPAPYALDEDCVWTVNGEAYDFSQPITQDLTIKAMEKQFVEIVVITDGVERVIKVQTGDDIDFSQFAKDGYTHKVMNDKGDIITSLTVSAPCAITVIYFKN